jgi:uncharacterized protein YecT (DUF1311 family)
MHLGRIGGLAITILLSACSASSHGSVSSIPSDNATAARQAEQSGSADVASEAVVPVTGAMNVSGTEPSMEPGLRDSYVKCAEATNGSTWEMQNCVEEEFEYQDARLNATYRQLQSRLPEAGKKFLVQDEKEWMSARDSSCEWNPKEEGQAQRVEANICSLKQTSDRADQLAKMLTDIDSPTK